MVIGSLVDSESGDLGACASPPQAVTVKSANEAQPMTKTLTRGLE
jgi:hypothetical protein